jgi:hypothetical protein
MLKVMRKRGRGGGMKINLAPVAQRKCIILLIFKLVIDILKSFFNLKVVVRVCYKENRILERLFALHK